MSGRRAEEFVTVTCQNCKQEQQERKTNLSFIRTEKKCQFFVRCTRCEQVVNVPLSEEEKENILNKIFKDFS